MQRKGEWRILGISSGERLNATGDLPTLKEQGVPLDLTGWWAAMVPMGTPKPVVDHDQPMVHPGRRVRRNQGSSWASSAAIR